MSAKHDLEDRKPMIETLYDEFADGKVCCPACGEKLYSIVDSWNHRVICKKRVQSK